MIKIVGPQSSKSRELLQSMVENIEGDIQITWGHNMDKLEQLEILEAAGVLCPRHSQSRRDLMCIVRGDVWGRKLNHSQGRDIKFPGDRNYEKSDYYVEPITDVKDEWRVHIFDGLSIHSSHKVHTEQVDNSKAAIVKSRRNGWRMSREKELPRLVRDTAKAAVKALGWDMGAVDLIECKNGKVYVLEVNSRPGIDSRTAEQYVKAIKRRALALS